MDLKQLINQVCEEIKTDYLMVGEVFQIMVPLEDEIRQEVLVQIEEGEDGEAICAFSAWIKDFDPDHVAPSHLSDLLDHLLDILSRNDEFVYARIAWDPNDGTLKIIAKHLLAWLSPEIFQDILIEVAEESQFLQEDFRKEE